MIRRPPRSTRIDTLFPYTTRFRSVDTLLPRFGIETTTVDARDPQAFADALKPNTKVFFFETPANPTMDVVDLEAVCGIARANNVVRSEERRVGKACVSTCRSRWSPYN